MPQQPPTLIQKTATAVSSLVGNRQREYDYQVISGDRTSDIEEEPWGPDASGTSRRRPRRTPLGRSAVKRGLFIFGSTAVFIGLVVGALIYSQPHKRPKETPCPSTITEDIETGYQCHANISHSWGQYSPYFAVPSSASWLTDSEETCNVTMVQVLARHGARDPTMGKSILYKALVIKLKEAISANGTKLHGKYSFLKHYEYQLGSDQLTAFGREQLWNLGRKIHARYSHLLSPTTGAPGSAGEKPFVRTTSQTRVKQSGQYFLAGFSAAADCDLGDGLESTYPMCPLGPSTVDIEAYQPDVVIYEGPGFNNTLSHGTCPAFENSTHGSEQAYPFVLNFTQPIGERLNADLKLDGTDAELGATEVLYLMDLCPFETVADSNFDPLHGAVYSMPGISPFCGLFTQDEWELYGYYQSLSKYYGYGPGHELGPTQGAGWINELLHRLQDGAEGMDYYPRTNINYTLDSSEETFPLGKKIYADFSHDNDMIGIFSALMLIQGEVKEPLLPTDRVVKPEDWPGFSAAWTVPFGARLVVERLHCSPLSGYWKERLEQGKEIPESAYQRVRVLMNDRVVNLSWCQWDDDGYLGNGRNGDDSCPLHSFVKGLHRMRLGGKWKDCY